MFLSYRNFTLCSKHISKQYSNNFIFNKSKYIKAELFLKILERTLHKYNMYFYI